MKRAIQFLFSALAGFGIAYFVMQKIGLDEFGMSLKYVFLAVSSIFIWIIDYSLFGRKIT